jgi:hypothetical protein
MFNLAMTGTEDLVERFDQLQEAMQAVHGLRFEVHFDPAKPAEVQRAIREAEAAIDQRLDRLSHNPFANQIARSAKRRFRREIVKRVSEAQAHPSSAASGSCQEGPSPLLEPGAPISALRAPARKGGFK